VFYYVQPVLGGVRDVAPIHYPSCTDSIKPSLQFLCYFVVMNACEGSLCFQNCVLHNSRCQVPCGSRKKLLRTSLQCCYIFWSFRIINANTIKCWELSTAQAGARRREGCCTYSLSFMYRLNQTESAMFMLFCCD
jgi:hypothetical protein